MSQSVETEANYKLTFDASVFRGDTAEIKVIIGFASSEQIVETFTVDDVAGNNSFELVFQSVSTGVTSITFMDGDPSGPGTDAANYDINLDNVSLTVTDDFLF